MTPPEIQAARARLQMTQPQFARAVGLTGRTASRRVRGWEQGTYHPSGRAVEQIIGLLRKLEKNEGALTQ